MIRFVASFPGQISQEKAAANRDALWAAESKRAQKLVVLDNGGTITDLAPRPTPRRAFLTRARSRVR
jgi:hypothetical protein